MNVDNCTIHMNKLEMNDQVAAKWELQHSIRLKKKFNSTKDKGAQL